MFRDFKFLKRKQTDEDKEIENVHVNVDSGDTASSWSSASQSSVDQLFTTRPPLNTIPPDQVHAQNPRPDGATRSKFERTPTKPKVRHSDHAGIPLRTPDRFGGGGFTRQRFGWGQRDREEPSGLPSVTPRSTMGTVRGTGKANSESNSTQSTPTKSVSKPSVGRPAVFARPSNGGALYKGIPVSSGGGGVNSVEVPQFELKEDPSFWMDHNVQVLIRVRPLNSAERSTNGYNRCFRQESPQTITWISQPELRFTFDHVACETIDQELLFRMAGLPMVENCLSGYNSCIFAYGQTGSGKTYTMLGEIDNLEFKPSPNRGMTPRIFEFLFARIQAEEESRRDERLKYTCKCSFLEIYNEQITDLLDPSSSNLLLREDVKTGVYVENLSEFEVHNVSDILRLLTQGSLNRKVASTNMNRESSRSHCVFTCSIESRWENDSTINLRFARLNLVDLAGSERQKSSGAEGERLKEAANINKSLSTLGHVIMILVDVANGKHRHVPYRDSRLTFLLQDSLGGNSKTMIIANVSPSICCAAETLNTLKFAQRAKLIQNNAVVNEDSTGDVAVLQHQIRLLKDELSLLKRQNVARPLSFCSDVEPVTHDDDDHGVETDIGFEPRGSVTLSTKQIRSLESTLAGALRREQMAETTMKNLEAEIEHLNRLVRQREEETQSNKMMLRFREDKIQRMESLVGSSLNSDAYLMEENRTLSKEIQLLQAKVDKNPEVTRFALENIRLLDQLRRFQEFYEEGERMVLLEEVANLRGQLFQFVDKNPLQLDIYHGESETRLKDELNELEECRSKLSSCLEENKTLRREIHDLHVKLENLDNGRKDVNVDTAKDPLSTQHSENLLGKEAENKLNGIIPTSVVNHEDDILDLQLEVDILKIILKEERSSHAGSEHKASCLNKDLELAEANLLSLRKNFQDSIDELKETKLVLAALESQQILAIEEMEDLRKINFNHETLLAAKEHEIMSLKNQVPLMKIRDHPASNNQNEFSSLHRKLKRMQDSLEKAKSINILYQNDRAFQTSNEEEMDEVRRQAEAETAEAIVCMEEELCILQQQVHDCNLKEIQTKQAMSSLETELQELRTKISGLGEDNKRLHRKLEEQDMELRIYSEEWELLLCEMEEVLSDGQDAIADAAQQLDLITSSLPQKRIWISENVGRLSRLLSQKDMLIEELGRCLEEANTKRADLEFKVQSLRGAAMVINEAQQKECCEREKEALMLKSQLTEKMSCLLELEEKAKLAELEAFRTSTCATVAFIIVNHLAELNAQGASELMAKDIQLSELAVINLGKEVTSAEEVIHCLQSEVVELRNACGIVEQKLSDKGRHARNLEQMLEDLEHNDLSKMREKLTELNAGILSLKSCVGDASSADDFGSTCTDAGEDLRIISDSSPKIARSTSGLLDDESALGCSSDASNTALMKKEIELALESFQELKMVVIKQLDERNGLLITEKQYKLSTESFAMQLFALEAGISNFEQQFDSRIATIEQKLLSFEHSFREALTRWGQTKEVLELEIGDTKLYSVQKAAEASCIYAKFEEAQETLKEADIMLNELMVANEKTKLDKDRMKRKENRLTDERDKLIDQVQNLQSVNDLKDKHIRDMEEQYGTELMEMKNLVNELESVTLQLQKGFEESFSSMVHDFQGVETQLSDYGKLVKSWIGDIWSEIVGKDCAISVLHLCHMGVLLETVTGLNAEKSLLHHGLCESDSVIADLRKHNFKTSKELEMFRSLKEKLLVDIKGGFDRISRKEEEAGQLCGKLTSFEKRMLDLQLQEELMLQRADHMGSELAVLMEDLDLSNRNFVESLTDQDKMLQDKDDLCNSQAELFISNLLSKDVELCVMESFIEEMGLQKNASEKDLLKYSSLLENLKRELIVSNVDVELFISNLLSKDVELCVMQSFIEEMGLQKTASEKDLLKYSSLLENLKRELIVSNVDSELEGCELLSKESEIAFLRKQVEDAQREAGKMFSMLTEHRSRITELEKQNNGLSLDIKSLNDVDLLNSTLRGELAECMETKVRMTDQIHQLEFERDKLQKDLKSNLVTLEELGCREASMERESARSGAFLEKLKQDAILWLVDKGMQEQLLVLEEARVEVLENRVEKAQQESLNLSSRLGQSNLRNTEAEKTMKTLEEENASLQGKIGTFTEDMNEVLSRSDNNIVRCTGLLEGASSVCQRMSGLSREEGLKLIELLLQEISETSEKISCFMEEIERLECEIKELVHLNSNLDAELVRKEGIVKGLLFDLSLLQESASNSKDQKDKVEEMMASLEALEEELRLKSGELDEFVAHNQMLETRLQEKINMISNLESNYAREQESMRRCSSEILELRSQLQDALTTNYSLEGDLTEKRSSIEKLEMGLSQMCNDIDKMSQTIDSMRCELSEVTDERDRLNTEISYMKEELEKSQALAEENEAISLEAQQIAESRKMYADEKEAEVKLLERSVQELESTINVLENQMDILKGEAERQRLQREELEVELLAVHHQMQNVKSSDVDTQRIWDEKERDLQQALRRIKDLEKDIDDMEKEISKCHAHISELNLHSEAQASEYKQKFKELEAMVEQVKPEGHFFHANSSSNKSEKHAVKSRGSGSPFKCIGLGMVQQMKLEKDEELVAARLHIEELESQAVSRQKEIFALNARLAAAESMTHDVIRDLLGVKLDMSNYASLLDNQQVQKIAEKAQFSCLEPQAKEQEVLKLKQQLNEFIEERRGWIEDIDRKQAEMIAAQTALEKLRQRDQLLQSEIEFLKMENGNYKKRVMDLEGEVKELSGQQNLQQRIHHHAKIKEENNMLKLQNEELDAKLRRAERIMIRVKEELARYRASNGKCPYINFDEERRLMNKLKETEEDRVQLAQKLLVMCTSILKVAGITKPATEISPAVAEEALAQLNKTITSLEREIQNLLHKNRISNERIRLLEIRQQASSSPVNPRTDDNYSTPTRSQASFLSDFDR